MGKGIILRSGGRGTDLSAVTAGAGDVLTGKVIVDKNGNPVTGTIAVCKDFVKTSAVYANPDPYMYTDYSGIVVVPEGYYGNDKKLCLKNSAVVEAINLTPDKLVNGVKFMGVNGNGGLKVKYHYEGYISEPGYANFSMTSNDLAIVLFVDNGGSIYLDEFTVNDNGKWISDGWLEVQISGTNVTIYNYDESGVYGDIEVYVLPNPFNISPDRLYW